MSFSLLAPKRVDISDDNALFRLGVTYGVLRRLGYSEETVAGCLEAIDGIDLEEAHEWVCGITVITARCSSSATWTFLRGAAFHELY